jgi:hypothetical protein
MQTHVVLMYDLFGCMCLPFLLFLGYMEATEVSNKKHTSSKRVPAQPDPVAKLLAEAKITNAAKGMIAEAAEDYQSDTAQRSRASIDRQARAEQKRRDGS